MKCANKFFKNMNLIKIFIFPDCWFVIKKSPVHYFFSFIGELFNQSVVHPKIIQYHVLDRPTFRGSHRMFMQPVKVIRKKIRTSTKLKH